MRFSGRKSVHIIFTQSSFLAYRDNGIQLCHRQLLGSLHRRRNLLLVLKQWKWDKREWNEEWRKGEEKRRKKERKKKVNYKLQIQSQLKSGRIDRGGLLLPPGCSLMSSSSSSRIQADKTDADGALIEKCTEVSLRRSSHLAHCPSSPLKTLSGGILLCVPPYFQHRVGSHFGAFQTLSHFSSSSSSFSGVSLSDRTLHTKEGSHIAQLDILTFRFAP